MSPVPNRSSNFLGLLRASTRILNHGTFDLLSGQTPNLHVILAGFGNRRSRDVVAIASTALDGVRRGESVPVTIGQYPRQQARLGCAHLRSVTARLGGKLVPHGGPRLGIDYSGMLSGVELAFMGDLPEVDRVREQPVDVPAREQFGTALTAVRPRAPLGLEPELVSRLLDTPHAAM